jgi:hypothetical protein
MKPSAKVVQLRDEAGDLLPPNMAKQFRAVQGGLEHLKGDAETIILKLNKVGKTLNKNTTDLSKITEKVNSIESAQKQHIAITKLAIDQIKQLGVIVNDLAKEISKKK